MKILIATPLYPPDVGGPATYTALMEQALPPQGIAVTVLSWGRVRSLPPLVRHLVYLVSLMLHARGRDVVYALDPVSTGLPAAIAALILRKKFLLRVAGDFAWEQLKQTHNNNAIQDFIDPITFQKRTFDWLTELRRTIQRFVAHRADAIITPSSYLKGVIALWGVQAERIHVVHNSVSDLSHIGNKNVIREMLGVKGKLVITAGRLIPLKGIDTLIELLPILKKQFPDITLVIAGDGPDREQLMHLAKVHRVSDQVIFTGALQHDVLYRYIKAADVFVLNSWHETFPNVLLEAMSLGTPVVTAAVGGIPECIANEKEGLLVPPRDSEALLAALSRTLMEASATHKRSVAAQRKAATFDEALAVEKTLSILERL